MKETLRAVPLFADLDAADLDALSENVSPLHLERGQLLFNEGDSGDVAYVIDQGELEIVKVSGSRETLIAVRGPGEVIGEMALLNAAPRMATVRASQDTDVLAIPKASLDELLRRSGTAARGMFRVLLDRWAQTEAMLRQSERMAQLGTLTAGLAHELNNPASAIVSSAQQLGEAIGDYQAAFGKLTEGESSPDESQRVREIMEQAGGPPLDLSTLDRSDREAEIEDRLAAVGVDDPWTMAADLVSAGFVGDDIDGLSAVMDQERQVVLWRAAQSAQRVSSLLHIVEEGSSRVSGIVGALKSYSYLDQAPLQDVDVRIGLDDTLLILRSKLADIDVVKEYEEVPSIPAYAAELNQVWTNLIDNAADAIHETRDGGGRILLRVRSENSDVVVEVEDNGGGIPEEARPRIFDSFFTTKPPGAGTGLGLDITYNLVVHKHRGAISVEPVVGGTVFRVVLPQNQ